MQSTLNHPIPAEGEMDAKPEPGPSKGLPSVMIVDDSPANLAHLSRILREQGIEPRPFPRGKPALSAAKADPPDLILLDIDMPEMNGFEVCEALKADEQLKNIPVIFISGLSATLSIVKAFSLGGVDYVTKPFQGEEITARIWTHLRILSLQRQLHAQNVNLERQVAARTRELASASRRLRELGRLKDDFLNMIAHEIRTPATGVLGIGDLLIDLCPPSADRELYSHHFGLSKARLLNLIEDSALIADLGSLTLRAEASTPFPMILSSLRTRLPDIQIALEPEAALDSVLIPDDPELLLRALATMMHLAIAFSRGKYTILLTSLADGPFLRLRLRLDALSLPETAVADFFEIESLARAASCAESLGLAPAVAHKIISALGGELRLIKGEGQNGFLEAFLPSARGGVPFAPTLQGRWE